MRRLHLCALSLAVLATAVPATAASTAVSSERPDGISFRAPVDFATGATPSSAEFNRASGDQVVQVAFQRMPLTDSVAVGDFNDDGKPDVAQTNVIAGSVSVFLGDGRGGFAAPSQHAVGVSPVFVTTGDLDVDGDLDLAVADLGSDDVAILRGDGSGGFLPATFVPVPTPRSIAIGAFDDDPVPDLAVSSSAPAWADPDHAPQPTAGGVSILTGVAAGTFVPTQFITTTAGDRPVNANAVAAVDANGDGRADLAVGVGISPNAWMPQPGGSVTGDEVLVHLNGSGPLGAVQPFGADPDQRIPVGAWPSAIAATDLDGDAAQDLAVLDAGSGDVTTLLGDGAGAFRVRETNVTVGSIPRSLALADFDADGHLDLVTASFTASTVSVLAGNGDGTFEPAVDFWSGDATTSVAVGDFDGDGRDDVVAGRLRDDQLALLLNDSTQPGDGVVVARDIRYDSTPDDPYIAHHGLDVYTPPRGTPSFAGRGRAYPVVFFTHGGGGMSGDKTMVSYLLRNLALEGIVGVSTNYRLGYDVPDADQMSDVAQAFRWTRDHVGSPEFGGDPRNMFVFGHSAGAVAMARLATDAVYAPEQQSIRGLITAGLGPGTNPGDTTALPPSLLLNGDEGFERALAPSSASFSSASRDRGGESAHVVIPRRDHMTLLSDIAVAGDLGRVRLLDFIREQLRSGRGSQRPPAAAGPSAGTPGAALPATGPSDGWPALGALLLAAAARVRPAF